MKLFQRDEPLVHILYDKVNEVTRICFHMFLKTEVVAEKVGNELKAIDCEKLENWLPSKTWKLEVERSGWCQACQMISRRL